MKKMMLALLVLAMLIAMVGCGADKSGDSAAPSANESLAADQSLTLIDWKLTPSTWSSPNGATVNLTATPNGHEEGQSAAFIVRLEGEEIENIPCDWDGSVYTAAADLNGADGYCYYVLLTAADGTQTEVPVNTPTAMVDEALINMATALQSYCSLTVVASGNEGNKLTISEGTATIQLPLITDEGATILCREAKLVLTFNGEDVDSVTLDVDEAPDAGTYTLSIAGIEFTVPAMEDDQQVELRLDVTLSNDQLLSAVGGSWFYNNGTLMLTVG